MTCSNEVPYTNNECKQLKNRNEPKGIIVIGDCGVGRETAMLLANYEKQGMDIVVVPYNTTQDNLVEVLKEKGIFIEQKESAKLELKMNVGDYIPVSKPPKRKYKSWERPYKFHP